MTGGYTNHYTNENSCTIYNTHDFTNKTNTYHAYHTYHTQIHSYAHHTKSCCPNSDLQAHTSLPQTHKHTTDNVSEHHTSTTNLCVHGSAALAHTTHRWPRVIPITYKSKGKQRVRCCTTLSTGPGIESRYTLTLRLYKAQDNIASANTIWDIAPALVMLTVLLRVSTRSIKH